MKFVVADVDEIPPGVRKIVELSGRSIGVFNVGGQFYALRNRCPHQGGPLCEGRLFGAVEAAVPGEVQLSRAGEILTCAWHGWEFDIRTGQSWCDPSRLRVRTYEVRVERGEDVTSNSESAESRTKGTYIAETFPVSIDDHYVVIEVGV